MWILREATDADREPLADIYMSDREDNYIHALLFASELIANQKTILCFLENELVGILCWSIHGLLENGVCEITYINVRRGFQRKGAGKHLVAEAISKAETHFEERGFHLRMIFCFTGKSNTIVDSFFKSINFNQSSEISSFYPDDDAVIWTKHLEREK
jgi:ribosomal protein S18 acetylase RimI-like enzyme